MVACHFQVINSFYALMQLDKQNYSNLGCLKRKWMSSASLRVFVNPDSTARRCEVLLLQITFTEVTWGCSAGSWAGVEEFKPIVTPWERPEGQPHLEWKGGMSTLGLSSWDPQSERTSHSAPLCDAGMERNFGSDLRCHEMVYVIINMISISTNLFLKH